MVQLVHVSESLAIYSIVLISSNSCINVKRPARKVVLFKPNCLLAVWPFGYVINRKTD